MADPGVEERLTCPTCQSRIAIIETPSGGKMIDRRLERVGGNHWADIICPACDAITRKHD